MGKSTSIVIAFLSALVITCVMAAISARAQTAGNLKCNGCVSSKDIKNKSIRTNDIRTNAIRTKQIKNNAVTGAKVANGSLTAVDLGDGAGVDFAGGNQDLNLPLQTDTVVRSIAVTAPRNGFVTLNAGGAFGFGINAFVQCSLTTGSTLEPDDRQSAGGILGDAHAQIFGMTEGFVVPAGSTTFSLVCRELIEGVTIFDSDLTAIYVPTRY